MLLIVKEPKPVLIRDTALWALPVATGCVRNDTEAGEREATGTTAFTAKFAITIPAPTVRALKPAFAARAVLSIALLTAEGVREGFADNTRAAMDAAVGAAAEVPQNGLKPGTADWPQSAAVKSTLASVVPPFVLKRKFPAVIAEPSGLKKILRGPSEL
jgi:hypothetical protein